MTPVKSFVHCRLKIAAASATQGCRHVEQSDPLCELSLRVPAPKHVQQRREERALEEPHKESKRIQLTNIMHARLREREHAPTHFHNSQPQTRTHALNDQRARNLHHRIRDRVDTAGVCVFVAVHVELFLHARHVRIGHVALVEIFHEEAETADAEDCGVEFEEQTLLFRGLEVCVGVPDEGAEGSFLLGGRKDVSGIVGGIDLDIMAVDLFPGGCLVVRINGRHLVALGIRWKRLSQLWRYIVEVYLLYMSCDNLIAWMSYTRPN